MSESRRFLLIGHPVAHSISPELHAAAYRTLGVPHVYEKTDCPDEAAAERAIDALRRAEVGGINVTVPWKRLALKAADRQDDLARQIGAANVLLRAADGAIEAYNTDALALVEELAHDVPAPRVAAIIGSGGAARAAVTACRKLGAARVNVVARRFSAELSADFRALGATPLGWPESGTAAELEAADVVVQATSAGMVGADPGELVARIVPWSRLAPGALAYDVVYNPAQTPFLAAAAGHGVRARGGLGMLVGQAALSIELWLGVTAPRADMARAAQAALARRSAANHE
jgi:shikimate dehydrogenase